MAPWQQVEKPHQHANFEYIDIALSEFDPAPQPFKMSVRRYFGSTALNDFRRRVCNHIVREVIARGV